jgi:hypothetical protein
LRRSPDEDEDLHVLRQDEIRGSVHPIDEEQRRLAIHLPRLSADQGPALADPDGPGQVHAGGDLVTLDWRQLLLDKVADARTELPQNPTADDMEHFRDCVDQAMAHVIDQKRASDVDSDGQAAAPGYGLV